MVTRWPVAAMTMLACASAASAWGQPAAGYTFELVHALHSYPYYPNPPRLAINDNGEVAYATPSGIYVWDGQGSQFVGVGHLGGINNAGEVAFISIDRSGVFRTSTVGTTTIASGGPFWSVDIGKRPAEEGG